MTACWANCGWRADAGRHADADRLAEQIRARGGQAPLLRQAAKAHARSLLARKKHAEAAALLEPIVHGAAAPEAVESYLLGSAYLGQQKNQEALLELQTAAAKAGDKDLRADVQLARATALVALGREDDAIAPLRDYLRLKPSGSQAAIARGELAVSYAKLKRFDDARQAYADLRAQHAGSPEAAAATLRLAEVLYKAEQYPWCAELYASLAKEESPDLAAKGLSGLGWSQFKQGQLRPAAETFDTLLTRFPNDTLAAEAALTRGQILEQLKLPDPALAMYRRVIQQYPKSDSLPRALLLAAQLHDRLQQDREASELYQRLTQEFPQQADADAVLYEWGWVLRDLGQADEADQRFEQLRKSFPQSRFWADATFRLAARAFDAQQYQRADTLLKELIDSTPPEDILQHALYLQGRVAIAEEAWPRVADIMGRLARRFPDGELRNLADYWAAEAAFRQERFGEALKQFNKLQTQVAGGGDSWQAMAPLRRAQCLAHLKRWGEARGVAESIAKDFPKFDQMYEVDYLLGRCLASQALFDEAREAYARVLNSSSGGKTETAAMAQWMIGETFFHQKDYDTALRQYLRVEILFAYPTWQAAALLQAGKCYEHLGNLQQARKMYLRVVEEFSETEYRAAAEARLAAARR